MTALRSRTQVLEGHRPRPHGDAGHHRGRPAPDDGTGRGRQGPDWFFTASCTDLAKSLGGSMGKLATATISIRTMAVRAVAANWSSTTIRRDRPLVESLHAPGSKRQGRSEGACCA